MYIVDRGNSLENQNIFPRNHVSHNQDLSTMTRNRTYDASNGSRTSKRFAERNIPTLKEEIIRYLENDKKKNKKVKTNNSNTNLKKFLGNNMQITEKKIIEYLLENEHFDPKKRETLRNFF